MQQSATSNPKTSTKCVIAHYACPAKGNGSAAATFVGFCWLSFRRVNKYYVYAVLLPAKAIWQSKVVLHPHESEWRSGQMRARIRVDEIGIHPK